MSTIINTRSPFYFKVSNADLSSVKLELYIWTGTTAQRNASYRRYTLTKEQLLDELDRVSSSIEKYRRRNILAQRQGGPGTYLVIGLGKLEL